MPGTIVVGVDGSPESDAALRWALEEGRVRDATVRAIYAWEQPPLDVATADAGFGTPGLALPTPPTEYMEIRHAIEDEANRLLPEALERAGGAATGVEVEQQVVEGLAGDVLVEAARSADLLVVGSRGRGGLKGLLLGSVSQHTLHNAPCPVVVLPPVRTDS